MTYVAYNSKRYVLRADPYTGEPLTLFDVYTGKRYQIQLNVFLLLSILEMNALTDAELRELLPELNLEWRHIEELLSEDVVLRTHHKDVVLRTRGVRGRGVSLDELRRALTPPEPWRAHDKVPVTSTPRSVELHLTRACNLRCLHCAYDAGEPLADELTEDQLLSLTEELLHMRTNVLMISGGEPMLHPGLPALISALAGKPIRVYLLTNGILVDDELAELLSAPNIVTVISVDGADEETHNMLRGHGFRGALRAVELIRSHSGEVHVASVIHKLNYRQAERIAELAHSMGARALNYLMLDDEGRGEGIAHLMLDGDELRWFSDEVTRLRERYRGELEIRLIEAEDALNHMPTYQDLDDPIYCTAGTSRLAVRSDGRVFPCNYAFDHEELALGTLSDGLRNIWLRRDGWELFRGAVHLRDLHTCRSCEYRDRCSIKICRLRAYHRYGDLYAPSPGCALLKRRKSSATLREGSTH